MKHAWVTFTCPLLLRSLDAAAPCASLICRRGFCHPRCWLARLGLAARLDPRSSNASKLCVGVRRILNARVEQKNLNTHMRRHAEVLAFQSACSER